MPSYYLYTSSYYFPQIYMIQSLKFLWVFVRFAWVGLTPSVHINDDDDDAAWIIVVITETYFGGFEFWMQKIAHSIIFFSAAKTALLNWWLFSKKGNKKVCVDMHWVLKSKFGYFRILFSSFLVRRNIS